LHPELVLGRRSPGLFGTSASRRAALPSGAAAALEESADLAGETVVRPGRAVERSGPVLVVPELIDLSLPIDEEGGISALRVPEGSSGREEFESLFARAADPWRYTGDYERVKYAQTLDLVPARVGRALELACAEGHFTVDLASRARSVVAADISEIALRRARERCAGLENVTFEHLDLFHDPVPGGFDLVVCSEVLYFAGDRGRLGATARKLAGALVPGGLLVTAHANLVVDDHDAPGYDWGLPFGARTIGEALDAAGLRLVRELRMPLYRVQLWVAGGPDVAPGDPEIVELPQPTDPPERVAGTVRWLGGSPTLLPSAAPVTTGGLPILMYHRVAPDGSPETARYRVAPAAFEEQLRYLRDAGYRSATLDEWRRAAHRHEAVRGRAVILTFDDGTRDFAEHAWPLLRRYGFGAVVLLASGLVGGTNAWDEAYGEEVPLLGWDEIRTLRDEGAAFGAHSVSHAPLTALTPVEVEREAAGSRAALTRELGCAPEAFAYPYGDVDPAVRHIVGACGFTYGLTTVGRRARLDDDLLALPRIEVTGGDTFSEFVRKLGAT
jgi:peptidoglycan/xylan/chitin deacetylase (PgdA/CDA1 family)